MALIKEKLKALPQENGVYIFKDQSEAILYIGKAKNIKKRVADHFKSKLYPDNIIIPKIADIDFIITQNEKEAVILEGQLIKKFQPKYNTLWKDDKNYSFVAISKHDFPAFSLTHQPVSEDYEYIGPFVSAKELKKTLASLRKILPYRSCRNLASKPCLYFDLGLCLGYCQNKKLKSKYQRIVSLLKTLLRIYAGQDLRSEGYDISNIQGKHSVGSMVVFKGTKPDKKNYRLFKIKKVKDINDPASLKEIIRRRLKHKEWNTPSLFVLDGGKTQLSQIKDLNIPVLAMAKMDRSYSQAVIFSSFSKKGIKIKELPKELQDLFFAIRNESHRFAIGFHRKKRQNYIIKGQ